MAIMIVLLLGVHQLMGTTYHEESIEDLERDIAAGRDRVSRGGAFSRFFLRDGEDDLASEGEEDEYSDGENKLKLGRK